LLLIDPTALDNQRPRSAYTGDDHFFISICGLQVRGDVAPVLVERAKKPVKRIVKRNIVIPRDHNFRLRKCIQKGAGFLKLARSSALCEIAGDGD
jgi:hypothetical protein